MNCINIPEFKKSLLLSGPPENISDLLKGLWYEKNENWQMAHEIAQTEKTTLHDLLHAYLHRVEGDKGNANYWYKRAGRKMPNISFEMEWESLAEEFLTVQE